MLHLALLLIAFAATWTLRAVEPLGFTVELETAIEHDDGHFLWFHPRATPAPGGVVMTIQKHLKISDYYSGLHTMTRAGISGPWSGPDLPPELDWQRLTNHFLTLRNDVRGYHSTSADGLTFYQPRPWTFDDGTELGSYNTQQHWLTHSEGLFLVYTRRGATNDHIIRHRAPLFMAQVDPDSMNLLRRTERVVVPERGAELGNFGATTISPDESWVTVSEGMFMKDSKARGARGATFVARIRWSRPNQIAPRL